MGIMTVDDGLGNLYATQHPMKNWVRFLIVFLFLVVTLALPFAFFGDTVEALFTGDKSVEMIRESGVLGPLLAIAMLIGDLVLPIPTTAIFAALGIVYGPWLGGSIASLGSFLSGVFGYTLCRRYGLPIAQALAGPESLQSGERLFQKAGGWLVAFSRWLPLMPEVVSCLAGLSRMPLKPFLLALLCGVIPVSFVFAAIGHTGASRPVLTLILSAIAPLVLWLLAQPLLKRTLSRSSTDEPV